MKVAIVGAGLSGFACAHVLEQNGVAPVIFEMKDYIGEDLSFPAVLLNIFNTPIKSPIKQLSLKYGIDLRPHYILNEMILVAPSKTYTVRGNLGYVFRRNSDSNSLLGQVSRGANTPVMLNTFADVRQLKNEFDYVLLSSGNTLYTSTLKAYHETFNAFVRIATIKGSFKTNSATMWLNTEYAKSGFGYMVADTEKVAKIILIVPKVSYSEFEQYWNKFLDGIKLDAEITSSIDLNHKIGLLDSNLEDNVIFSGYSGCFIDSMLGFGSIKAVYSGADAATCMLKGLNYDVHMKAAIKDMKKKYELRKAFDSLDNDGIDRLVSLLNKPVIKQLVYSNPLFYASQGALGAKMYNILNGNRY